MRVAVIQLVSSVDIDKNLEKVRVYVKRAVDDGASLVVLPENFASMERQDKDKLQIAEKAGDGKIQAFLSGLAAEHKIWIVGGTVPLTGQQENKVYAACILYDDNGKQVAAYNKIHLFDVQIPDSTEKYLESDYIESGNEVVVVDTPFGRLGLSVCYDIRFPELFRKMLDQSVDLIAIPSAFTERTGKAHWELLTRARAVENSCYVLAANQGGIHENGRRTWGYSMIVDPWGDVLAQVEKGEGYAVADIVLAHQKNIRENFPSISHRRL